MAKEVTRERAETMRKKAVAILQRFGQSDHAQEFEDMNTEEYAEREGLHLANPRIRRTTVSQPATGPTKANLQDQIDSAIDALSDAYQPESTREDLAEAIGTALDILQRESDDEDQDDED